MKELDVLKRELARRMRAHGLTAMSLAAEAGLPRDAVRDILRGRSKAPTGFTLAAVARRLGCSVEDMLGRPSQAQERGLAEPQATYESGDSPIEIAALEPGSAGAGSASGRFVFPPGEFDVPAERLRIVTVVGDSMLKPGDPSSLQAGDRVVIDTGRRTPSPPGIFALRDRGDVVVACVETVPGSKRLRVFGINPTYSPREIAAASARIGGRVIGVWRRL